jgi:hypothetical protein
MDGNNKNDTTHKAEIKATMLFTQSLAARQKTLHETFSGKLINNKT